MKKSIVLILACLLQSFAFSSKEAIDLGYFKLGTEIGGGYRHHQNAHGFDVSVNVSTLLLVDSWVSVKGFYLNYPFYDRNRYFYIGTGVGAVNEWMMWFGPGMGGFSHKFYPSIEGVIGYEFCSEKRVKTFLQLEGSVPLSRETIWPIVPAITFEVVF